ncbi:MAG TPA: universal stress protein [Candidatus Limnocylindrales bacterium]|nr:universal stress protein [Candidatus Limnocylindrales bacterium]
MNAGRAPPGEKLARGRHHGREIQLEMTTAKQTTVDRTDQAPRFTPSGPRVLLAADESDGARAGESWIRRLRWARRPEIDVLTVAPPPAWTSGFGLQTYRPAVRDAVIEARHVALIEAQRVANVVGSRLQESGVRVRVWARHGDVADEIVRMAGLEAPDLLVVGRGRRAWRGLPWVRSVADRVALEAEVAVLVAHPPPPGDEPLPRRIVLVGSDPSADDDTGRWLARVGWVDGAGVSGVSIARAGGADEVAAVVEGQGPDLAIWPRADRRTAEAALSLADATGVSVLLVPLRPPRGAAGTGPRA